MNYSPILIVSGEPNSVFFEIFFKSLKKNKVKSPIILISSEKLLKLQMKKLNYKKSIKKLNIDELDNYKLNNKSINLINVEYSQKKAFEKISSKSNKFIKKTFDVAFNILSKGKIHKFINGPVSKKSFLQNKYLGITEYISKSFSVKKTCMLIYNKNTSVCPITTHLPIKLVTKKISFNQILEKVILVNNFYKTYLKKKPKIAILGLNPHCESIHKFNEDEEIIKPAIKKLKKNISFLVHFQQIQFF